MGLLSTFGSAAARAYGFTRSAIAAAVDQYFNLTTLLLPGNGTNGAQNNTFLDSSSNNFTITRNGNATQGTFSPFSQTGWSNYFNGSTDYLLGGTSADYTLGTGDYSIEFWMNALNTSGSTGVIGFGGAVAGVATVFINAASGTANIRMNASGGTAVTTANNVWNANQWTHVVITRASGFCRIFVDGVLRAYASFTDNLGGTDLSIGRSYFNLNQEYFAGYLSNVRLVKGSVPTAYQTSVTTTGTSVFTPPTTALTDVTNTKLLTCQSNRFIDTNTQVTAKTITPNGSVSVQAFSPFAPTAAYSAATNGGSGYFDGNGDYLTGPANTALNFGTGDFCVELWIYPSDLTFRIYLSSSDGADAQIGYDPGNGPRYLYFYNNVNVFSGQTAGFRANQWNHIVLCRSGTTLSYYCNGTRAYTNASYSSSLSFSTPYVGAYSAGGYNYLGNISGVRLVKGSSVYTPSSSTLTVPTAPPTAITNTSLLLNFTNAGITDATGKNVLETVGNAQISTTQSKFGGSSMYFDGNGDYLFQPATPNLTFGSGDFTLEMWVYPLSLSATLSNLFAGRPASTNGAYPLLYATNSSTSWFTNTANQITGAVLTTNTWSHVAVCRSGTSTRLFINGVQSGSTYTDSTNYLLGRLYIGASDFTSGTSEYFNGYIDDLRVTKGYARYTANFTPPTAAFALQ